MSYHKSPLTANISQARTSKSERTEEEMIIQNSPASLRIAIIGIGRIGSAFAFHLIRNGNHDVTVVARPFSVRLKQLQRDSGVITSEGLHASAKVSDCFDEHLPYDLVLVTVLGHQVEGILPSLRRSPAKFIHFMFNTFCPEYLQQVVGVERAVLGMPFIQSNVDARGLITTSVGGSGQQTLTSNQECANIFKASGLPTQFEGEMALWLKCHVPLCVAFESISVTGERRGSGAP